MLLRILLSLLLTGIAAPAAADGLTAWRHALAQPGGDALADVTRLPFLYEGRPRGRAAFVAEVVPQLFTPARRACLQRAVPTRERDGQLVLWCAPYAFYLAPGADGWRLVAFTADPEALADGPLRPRWTTSSCTT